MAIPCNASTPSLAPSRPPTHPPTQCLSCRLPCGSAKPRGGGAGLVRPGHVLGECSQSECQGSLGEFRYWEGWRCNVSTSVLMSLDAPGLYLPTSVPCMCMQVGHVKDLGLDPDGDSVRVYATHAAQVRRPPALDCCALRASFQKHLWMPTWI